MSVCRQMKPCLLSVLHQLSWDPMASKHQKELTVTLKCASIATDQFNHTEYVFGNLTAEFDETFTVRIRSLHDALFGEVLVGLYQRFQRNQRRVGVLKIRMRPFFKSNIDGDVTYKILPPDFQFRADFYEQEEFAVGEAILSFSSKVPEDSPELTDPPITSRNFLSFFIVEDSSHVYNVLSKLMMETKKGTFLCRMKWLIGLFSVEYYCTHSFSYCEILSCSSGTCSEKFCKRTYGNLPADLLEEAATVLQYAAASFANSIVLWRLKKPRQLPQIKDRRRRAILERLGVPDEDLFRDQPATNKSLAFIAFFVDNKMVVSFKGTTSGLEALHDLNCEYAEFQDGYAHSGIIKLTDYFLENSWPELVNEMERRGICKVLFTGHSLGAAASTLAYLRLQEHGVEEEMEIEVIGYGAPPVVSANIAARNITKIKIFNYGADLVSCLSFGSVMDLKYICISISSLYEYVSNKKLVLEKMKRIKEYLRDKNIYEKLYHVGRLYHIKEFKTPTGTEYLYKEVGPEFFDELHCTKWAIFDHFLHYTLDAFTHSLERQRQPPG